MPDQIKPRSAFEDALYTGKLPDYYREADNMNVANRNATFLDSAAGVVSSVQKFIGVSLISGANEIYNIPKSVGNLLGSNYEITPTEDVVALLNDDLSSFYKEHQGGADLVGFMASSIVPGALGIKVLNAGQRSLRGALATGTYGKGMGKALGLLVPSKKNKLAAAVKEVATGSAPARLSNRNALSAIASGAGQNILEAAAFEVAVATTMSSSPILENQDFGDFVSNIAIGGLLFGAIGGTIDIAKTNSALKAAARSWDLDSRPFTYIEEATKNSNPYESISLDLEQLKNMPEVLPQADSAFTANLQSVRSSTVRKLNNRIRKQVGKLAKDDQEVATMWYGLLNNTNIENQQYNYIDLTEISRLGHTTKEITELERNIKKLKQGKMDLDDPFLLSDKHIAYVKQWGDDLGQAYETVPPARTIADGLGTGDKIKVHSRAVSTKDEVWKFSLANNTGKKADEATAEVGDILREGMSPRDIEARYIWSRSDEVPSFTKTLDDPKGAVVINGNDLPILEKLLREVPNAMDNPRVTIVLPKGTVTDPKIIGLEQFVFQQKVDIANQFLARNEDLVRRFKDSQQLSQAEIAKAVNVRDRFLSGVVENSPIEDFTARDMLALDSYTEELAERMGVALDGRKLKIGPSKEGGKEIWELPQTVRAVYDGKKRSPLAAKEEVNNFVTENMVVIKEHQQVYQDGLNIAAAGALGEEVMKALPEITTPRVRTGAVSTGAGAGRFTAASSNFGSLAALVEYVGSVTSRAINAAKDRTRGTLEPYLYALSQNQEAAIEWSVLNSRVRSIPGEYALNETGDALIPAVVKRYEVEKAAAIAGKSEMPDMYVLPDSSMPMEILLVNKEVRDMVAAHIGVNGDRTGKLAAIRAAEGVELTRAVDSFYPIPVNPKDYKHFAMVVDRSATGGNANKTLFATTADELKQMKAKIEQGNPQLEVLTKGEAEEYYKAWGQWDYEKTLNSTYLNTEAKRAGTSAPYVVSTDPQKIVDDALSWHMQRETGLVREGVSAKYEVQFEELRRLGDEATNLETSKFSDQNLLTFAEEVVKNPFANYIKTALAIRDTASYPIWSNLNTYADQVISTTLKRVGDVFYTSKGTADVGQINGMLQKAGYKGAAYDEQMNIFANSVPTRGTLSAIVQKANSTLATVILRWDFLNAINNAVSANVLFGAEMKAVQRAMLRGDEQAIGELAKLTRITVPGSTQTIQAPTKLISNSIAKLHDEGFKGPTMQFYKDNGYLTSITDQYRDAINTLSYTGRESVDAWNSRMDGLRSRMRTAGDAGEKWTGNKLAEEFNRFIAADVMKQITDIPVSRGLISAQEQLAYINTFVNRTQGNYLAAQRPMAFQGPIGQAIGLFQTYQFNLLQQLFRHVGEGHAKDALTLLGLQGTIHGMNGLPAFNAVNTHIVGSASGNQSHRDVYDATYGIVGKDAGDFLMYGAASTALGLINPDLKVNIYTRGDLNPRHITLLPTDPAAVPFIQAFTKFAKNVINTGKTLTGGGDVGSIILQGFEHNGISRPLAGLAQTLKGFNNPQRASFSTSKRGNVIGANDVLSLANLARIAGGKPLDEAIALDATYRFRTYGLKDSRAKDILGQSIKSTMIAGKSPSQEQIEQFASSYAAIGGRQEEFAGWMTQLYKTANTSQANEIQRSLKSPFTQAMQEIMGGEQLRDFESGGF